MSKIEGEIVSVSNHGSIVLMFVLADDESDVRQVAWDTRCFQDFVDNHELTDYSDAIGIRVAVYEDDFGHVTIGDI